MNCTAAILFMYLSFLLSLPLFAQDTLLLQQDRSGVQPIYGLQICPDTSDVQHCDGERVPVLINGNFPLGQPSWIQAQVYLPDTNISPLTIKTINLIGAQQIYWDGELLDINGQFDSSGVVISKGRYQNYAVIPNHLTGIGMHQLHIRHIQTEAAHYPRAHLLIGDVLGFMENDARQNYHMLLMLTVFLLSGVFFLIFYFGFGRKLSFLWLSLYCIGYVIKSLLKPYQEFFVPDFLIPFLSFDYSIFTANIASIFLLGFVLWELEIPRRWWHFLAAAAGCVLSYFLLTEIQFLSLLVCWSLLLSTWGYWHKATSARWIIGGLLGLGLGIAAWHFRLFSYGYFLGVIFFIAGMLLLAGRQVAAQVRDKQQALLRSSTLENQLLKKSIQPHFIFNSLASLQELIEQDPDKASHFVERLADEFRFVNKVAKEKLIAISEEVEMCKVHLRIMEYRRNATFTFTTAGIQGDELVPPGIFHTLVENGLTHGYGDRRRGVFSLRKDTNGQHIRYTFFNDSQNYHQSTDLAYGTGLRYVEARLNEAYGHNWHLQNAPIEGGWQVIITIPQKNYEHASTDR